jgi:hypothetical protein
VFSTVTKLSISDATFDLGNGVDQRKGLALLFQRASQRNDGLLRTLDAVEAAATDGLAGDQREPALDEGQPRGTGRVKCGWK